ncbi:hypothetical protein K4A83_06265 [Spirulina subsalsa FACHB-351]|uniref:Uncharacterized protein n=1 Tax=Spirulina subsalsa FACHB-351 TaxID=234711 RepID=A0ABT3L3W7_9CYAN|nr:hypothetical protein [Spirulina subsalsa]MCW6035877.1 hypothetical protein [Spirulina subsalsa FACHB-351]
MQPQPNCCPNPHLTIVQQLCWMPSHGQNLQRCRHCGTYWRFDWEERMNFEGGEDYVWEYYTCLTPEETEQLRKGEEGDFPNS